MTEAGDDFVPDPCVSDQLISNQGVCTVAVDVGNTACKLAVLRDGTIIDHAIAIDTDCWHSDAIAWVLDQQGCQKIRWRVSSVHRGAVEKLVDAVAALPRQDDHIELVRYEDVPMAVHVDSPDRLGIDRLLSAYAATRLPSSDHTADGLVVVDAGSAITVDWVDREGGFRGGAILPGLNLQAKALATGTDALPQVDWAGDPLPALPATNTLHAISGGILLGVASAIDALARRYFDEDVPIDPTKMVLTGGDSATLSPLLQCHHQCHPNLVCRGLLELPTRRP